MAYFSTWHSFKLAEIHLFGSVCQVDYVFFHVARIQSLVGLEDEVLMFSTFAEAMPHSWVRIENIPDLTANGRDNQKEYLRDWWKMS